MRLGTHDSPCVQGKSGNTILRSLIGFTTSKVFSNPMLMGVFRIRLCVGVCSCMSELMEGSVINPSQKLIGEQEYAMAA